VHPVRLPREAEDRSDREGDAVSGDLVHIEEHSPGWLALRTVCLNCAKRWVAVIHEDDRDRFMECPRCHEFKGLFLDWETREETNA
jgi:hypothetical protein